MPPKPQKTVTTKAPPGKGGKARQILKGKTVVVKGRGKGMQESSSQEALPARTPEKYVPKLTPQEAMKIAKLDGQKCFQTMHIAGKIIDYLIEK